MRAIASGSSEPYSLTIHRVFLTGHVEQQAGLHREDRARHTRVLVDQRNRDTAHQFSARDPRRVSGRLACDQPSEQRVDEP
ncbi:hypothetical protein GCM10028801_11440 [Nocardioides maradonensis]